MGGYLQSGPGLDVFPHGYKKIHALGNNVIQGSYKTAEDPLMGDHDDRTCQTGRNHASVEYFFMNMRKDLA